MKKNNGGIQYFKGQTFTPNSKWGKNAIRAHKIMLLLPIGTEEVCAHCPIQIQSRWHLFAHDNHHTKQNKTKQNKEHQ